MGEPIPEGEAGVPVYQIADGRGEYVVMCSQRCIAKLIKDDVVHECVLHRDHQAVVAQHVCNCGLTWGEADQ